jgi:outer membrane biosynthesis protein TonB
VVSATGEVESVKLVSGQTSALSGMQFSAMKAWRFVPATRGGEPVRYRLRIRLSAQ